MEIKYILKQLKKDLIGKDSHRGVSLTYAWLANQFGHFSLGFLPVIFLLCFYSHYLNNGYISLEKEPYVFAIIVALTWFLFEAGNFLIPILFSKQEKVFTPQWNNLAFDTLTDVLFFTLGAFSASLSLELIIKTFEVTLVSKWGVLLTLAILFLPCKYWYSVRVFQQYAYLPFQFRLSQWSNTINKTGKIEILNFLNQNSVGNHLLIFGGHNCGKTSLGVGIANELAIKFKKTTYTSIIKLSCFIVDEKEASPLDLIWSWREADLLIVDDINPGKPIEDEIFTPVQFLAYIDSKAENSIKNRALIANKNMVWILGYQNETLECSWGSMLTSIGVQKEKIKSITLC